MPIDITGVVLNNLISSSDGTKVTAAFTDSLVSSTTSTKVTATLVEALVAPDLDTTKINASFMEALVSEANQQAITSILVEVLVGPALPAAEIDLPIELHIVEIQEPRPLTDRYSETHTIEGWQWDRRRLEDSRFWQNQYNTYLGGHLVGHKDGTVKSWWQSGTNQSCNYKSNTNLYVNDYYTWTPIVDTGTYYLQSESHILYSDYSYTSKFSNDILDNTLMFHTLHDTAQHNTIQVALWYRDDSLAIRKYWDFEHVSIFTGEIDEINDARLDTEDINGTILPNTLSSRKKEFLIKNSRILLNGNFYKSNVFESSLYYSTVPKNSLDSILENIGSTTENGTVLYSKYLPIQTNSHRLLINVSGTLVEYTPVTSLVWSGPTDEHYEIDEDLGIVTIGGKVLDSLRLSTSLAIDADNLTVYLEPEVLSTYPQQGVLVIGSEEISYLERTGNQFLSLTRGYNSTTPSAYNIGESIAHRQMGKGATGSVYLEYIAVPRIDYEVTSHTNRTANSYDWLDIQPIRNVETTNILQIYPGEISLDRIVLSTDTNYIGGIIYGPLYYGSDVSELTATAYDINNYPVPDINLTIDIVDGFGYLNGVLDRYTDISNTLGQIYAYYNHPLLIEEIEQPVDSVSHNGANTEFVVSTLSGREDVEDIWVYQILKFDKNIGTVGLPLTVRGEGSADLPYGVYYLELDGVLDPEDYRDGVIQITISNITYTRSITYVENYLGVSNVKYTRIYLNAALVNAINDTAYCFEPQAIPFVSSVKNGVRHILYEYDINSEHPLTGELGAYAPIHPSSISGNTLVFDNRLLPIPDLLDKSVNVAGYVVVAPSSVILQAYGTDPIRNNTIRSNFIEINLELPNYMIGVDRTGVLPVPKGWTFPTDEANVGSGLSGANFITINNQAGPNQMALSINIL